MRTCQIERRLYWKSTVTSPTSDQLSVSYPLRRNRNVSSQFDYNSLINANLRKLLRELLHTVVKEGFKGDTHFYLTFATRHPKVVLPDRLKERYQEEMTIVLQHQFWNLDVFDNHFCVSLSFDQQAENLEIPFASIIRFSDPSAKFGLTLTPDFNDTSAETSTVKPVETSPTDDVTNLISFDFKRRK